LPIVFPPRPTDSRSDLIARHRKVRLELGRTFIRIKATLKHGRWKSYFHETFASCDIDIRTAQRYMELARASEADQDSKNEKLSLFEPAKDPEAVKIRRATAKARAEVGDKQKEKVRTFKLPLVLSIDEQEATRVLLNSPDWPSAQRKIVTLLKQLCKKFRIFHEGARSR
jgi:hypothetical protein